MRAESRGEPGAGEIVLAPQERVGEEQRVVVAGQFGADGDEPDPEHGRHPRRPAPRGEGDERGEAYDEGDPDPASLGEDAVARVLPHREGIRIEPERCGA